ncbi:MAG: dehydrogenase [Candidatus Firestonebacteria bacterium]
MQLIINDLLIPVEKDGGSEYITAAAEKLSVGEEQLKLVKILFKELEAENPEQFYYRLSIVIKVAPDFKNKDNLPLYFDKIPAQITPRPSKERPIVIGFGPAGMFAALSLLEYGQSPLIFERGKKIEERRADINTFIKERILNPESNIQFGEGGAGSYSDGKLFARAKNSIYINKVLDTLVKFGAPPQIKYTARPHLGTDVLCEVVKNIRNYIIEKGGEVFFNSKMTDLLIREGKVKGVVINGKREHFSSSVYLAVGHSARDTFLLLNEKGVTLEQKPISVGIRVEHPVEIINQMKYGEKYKNFSGLGAASYSFNYTDEKTKRRLNTFCMCPGGEVVNASSEPGLLVVNGMSYSKRDSAFSNTAFIITCQPSDYPSASPLSGLEFQKEIEQKAYDAGGGSFKVPAQNLSDFLAGRKSAVLNKNSCKIGTKAVGLEEIFPKFISETLLAAFNRWGPEYPSFVSEHGLLLAPETRTSCAARIKRTEGFESVNIKGLYPAGEGAGYTGGITSSAADGIKAVEKTNSKI